MSPGSSACAAGCRAIMSKKPTDRMVDLSVCHMSVSFNSFSHARHRISPCTMDIQPSFAAAQSSHALDMRSRSVRVAMPCSHSCSAILDSSMRSDHMPPHQLRASGVDKHHVLELEVMSVNPACCAHDNR